MANDEQTAKTGDFAKELREATHQFGDQVRSQSSLIQKLDNSISLQVKLFESQFPYSDGVFHEDRQYDVTLEEMKQRLEAARNDKQPEHGYLFSAHLSFYGSGGKRISGILQLDGGEWAFDEIATMYERGLTEPLPIGWYVASYNTSKNIYGVAFRALVPLTYNERYRIYISNNNARTATTTGNVIYQLQATRFIKNKVSRALIKDEVCPV